MNKNDIPEVPREGIIYGEITYWMLLVGMAISIIGLVIYIVSPSAGFVDKTFLLDYLWQGYESHTIYEELAGVSQIPPWYAAIGMLSKGDMIAMLGVAICGVAATFGIFGMIFQLRRSKQRLFLVFALIIAVVLTLSTLGLVSMH
jgi:hypothetical protein